MHDFGLLSELRPFQVRFYFVTSIGREARANVCNIGCEVKGKCTELFPKYWIEGQFLTGNNIYLYKEDDLSDEGQY